eukprot:c13119_g1_i1 orf=124-720(+)
MAAELAVDQTVKQDGKISDRFSQSDDTVAPSKALVTVFQPKDDTVGRFGFADGEASPGSGGSLAVNSLEGGSLNHDFVLARLNQEKILSIIRAWDENAKAKSINRYNRKLAKVSVWESAKKVAAEARLRTVEEKLEKKRAGYIEETKNEIASVHRKAEEEKALAEARHGEQLLTVEEKAAKFRASGKLPKKSPFHIGG